MSDMNEPVYVEGLSDHDFVNKGDYYLVSIPIKLLSGETTSVARITVSREDKERFDSQGKLCIGIVGRERSVYLYSESKENGTGTLSVEKTKMKPLDLAYYRNEFLKDRGRNIEPDDEPER